MDNSERSPVPIKLRDMLSKGLTEFRADEPRLDTSFQMAKLVRVDSAAPMRRRKQSSATSQSNDVLKKADLKTALPTME